MNEQTVATLTALSDLTAQLGYPPTVREIAAVTGLSVSTVQDRLVWLEATLLLTAKPKSPRTHVLTTKGRNTLAAIPKVHPDQTAIV